MEFFCPSPPTIKVSYHAPPIQIPIKHNQLVFIGHVIKGSHKLGHPLYSASLFILREDTTNTMADSWNIFIIYIKAKIVPPLPKLRVDD